MASNLDQLSNGRLILGVGVGWARAEFEALGIAFTRRGRLSDDYLEILKTHWAQPLASAQTRSVQFTDVHTAPAPKQHPHPPIWVGGRSPAAIRRTVRFGQAWHPLNVGLEWLSAEGLPLLRRTADELQTPMPAFAPRIKVVLTEAPLDDAKRGPGQGTLDQIRRDMDQLASLDPAYVVLDTYTGEPQDLPNDDATQRTLDAMLEQVIDLSRGTLR
jgi:alkanesulfonate monooxygenase SsuD/methylene tetrahydromethanopterin reductase-like flavin-dependent oxidoreductase (luciferase family)